MKNFILFGSAGYVAPKHMKAIKENNGNLLAIIDPHDSVGVIDSYFPECKYFREFERLGRYVHKLLRQNINIDYVSIATPNYLHDAQCRWGIRIGADVICEKPLVLNERNLDGLLELQDDYKKNIYGLYQLRYHDSLTLMKKHSEDNKHNYVGIQYYTPRGPWYEFSWKGDIQKSGGIETNIGCHLFDICSYVFGDFISINLDMTKENSGFIQYKNADVAWTLSTKEKKPLRHFAMNNLNFSFDSKFTDLHTLVYEKIINGYGIKAENFRQSIKICETIREKRYGK